MYDAIVVFYDAVINRRHLAVPNEFLAPDFEECKAEGADRGELSADGQWQGAEVCVA